MEVLNGSTGFDGPTQGGCRRRGRIEQSVNPISAVSSHSLDLPLMRTVEIIMFRPNSADGLYQCMITGTRAGERPELLAGARPTGAPSIYKRLANGK